MLYMNDFDIEMAKRRIGNHPILGEAIRFLQDFKEEVDQHSDGWAYWRLPVASAAKLMTLIQHPETATMANLKAALTPIKSFYTRHGHKAGMKLPSLPGER